MSVQKVKIIREKKITNLEVLSLRICEIYNILQKWLVRNWIIKFFEDM